MRSHVYFLSCLVLVLCLHSVVAVVPAPGRRQLQSSSVPTPVPTTIFSSTPTTIAPSAQSSKTDSVVSSSSFTSTASQTSVANVTSQPHPTSSAAVRPIDPLPIKPVLSSAMGITGTLLILTGMAYAMIGIKNKWVYVFGSAAYLTALAVTVLVVYLMNPPISNAVQGAFFIAAFLTGIIFGVLSLVFSDITEGLGCLLGGFCLSMWFMCLKSGGLISSPTGRAIFIGCFCAGGYAFSFSHYTRNHGLIVSIALSGASATILGIDCFARAGLKEFWLYIWNLNDNIFPLNTNTYPVTKNIKAELAGIVMIAIVSLVTQLRVRKLVQDHRAKSAAQQLEKRQLQDREELAVGRKVENKFQRERVQWEAAYGDKSIQNSSFRSSIGSPKGPSSFRDSGAYGNESVEMVSLAKGGVRRSIKTENPAGTTITVSVLDEDNGIQHIDADGNPIPPKRSEFANDSEASDQAVPNALTRGLSNATQSGSGKRDSLRPSAPPPPPPVVIPLPFVAPIEDDENEDAEDRASVSAEPETNHDMDTTCRPTSKRISDVAALRRSLSRNKGESQEALVKVADDEHDRASSVAATLNDDHDNISLDQLSGPLSPVISKDHELSGTTDVKDFAPSSSNIRHSVIVNSDTKSNDSLKQPPSPLNEETQAVTLVSNKPENDKAEHTPIEGRDSQPERAESHVGSLQDGFLPKRLSKVAVSFRTNEWAKHLESAEKPELDDLSPSFSPRGATDVELQETPALVSDEIASPLARSQRNSRRLSGQNRPSTHSGLPNDRPTNSFFRESVGELRSNTKSPPVMPPASLSRPNSAHRLSALSPLPNNTLLDRRESMIKSRISSQTLRPNSSSTSLLTDLGEQENMTLAQRRQVLQNSTSSSTLQHQTSTTKSHRKAPPSASQKWQKKGWTQGAPAGFDSHQPQRTRSSQSDQKREELYSEWRENMREASPRPSTGYLAEQQREAMMSDRRQKELEKQQCELMQQQRASQMESMMRSGQMQDAHREAMRKMQANANKGT